MSALGDEILERAAAHYRASLDDLVPVEVPEWGATLYFRRSSSLRDKGAIADAFARSGATAGYVEAIIRRARDHEGNLLWGQRNRPKLEHEVDGDLVERIFDQVTQLTAEVTVADAEGN